MTNGTVGRERSIKKNGVMGVLGYLAIDIESFIMGMKRLRSWICITEIHGTFFKEQQVLDRSLFIELFSTFHLRRPID